MSLVDFKVDVQFLQSHVMSFKIPANDVKTYHLQEDAMLEFDEEFYYISKLGKARVKNEAYVSVEANAMWYRLGERGYSGEFSLTAVTPEYGLQLIMRECVLADLDWLSGTVSSSTTLYSLSVTDGTFLDIIYQWAKICGCEVTFNTRDQLVNMRETLGGNYGLSFRYTRNLQEIERTAIPPEVTRFYPYGRLDLTIAGQAGQEYLEDYSYYTGQGLTLEQAQISYRKDYRLKDDSFIDDVSLYNWAVGQMETLSQPRISYKAKVVDLTRITGYQEDRFGLGDSVVVEDEPLGISVISRVVRYVRYPYEPARNEVELAFEPIALPDPNASQGRPDAKNWELFHTSNLDTDRYASVNRSVLHRLPLLVNTEAEWIMSYSLKGVCETSGTLQITFTNDHNDELVFPTFEQYYSAGENVVLSWNLANELVPVETYQITVRMEMIDTGRIFIPGNQSHFWVFGRGMVRGSNPAYTNSIRYDFTGATQTFRVPDDVNEILIEGHGSAGGRQTGGGGMVTGLLDVISGDYFDIDIGGNNPNWPNGGDPGFSSGGTGGRGGGSTSIRRQGLTFADSIMVCAGGGGGGESSASSPSCPGGAGGFLAGGDGKNNAGDSVASGGTQTGPGPDLGPGAAGSFNQGGKGNTSGNFFDFDSGGGGGGWYGGEGGKVGGGGSGTGGGGGGSGWAIDALNDLEYQDGENTGLGYMIISWADPEVPGV